AATACRRAAGRRRAGAARAAAKPGGEKQDRGLLESIISVLTPRLPGTSMIAKFQSVVQMLQRAAQDAESRASEAERHLASTKTDLAEAMKVVEKQKLEMKKLKSLYLATTRYAESVEEERDEARDELVAALEQTLRAKAVAGMMPAQKARAVLDTEAKLAPTDMSVEEL
ncbi:unnamed protein product, partial [Prorocentrum cordatum]